jgi:hypothetical protein
MTHFARQRTGLFAALCALAIQLGLAASVPPDLLVRITPGVLCHTGSDGSPAPGQSDGCVV